MSGIERVVIAGGGLAGARAALGLRAEGFGGRVTLVSAEEEWPYERPPLSKGYLRGEEPIDKAYVRPPAEYATNDIELLRGVEATAIDPVARRVTTSRGELEYDALVLATGAEPRRLDVPGADLDGIHYLRSATDADRLRAAALAADHIVVIGGGWIGTEVAASLNQLGRSVTVVMSGERPLEHVLGEHIADVYKRVHLEHGVTFVTGRVARLHGHDKVEAVETIDGRRINAELVVVGIGAVPRAALAQAAGLSIHRGAIAVDEHLRSSDPNIQAIGDVATAWNPRYQRSLRMEHWDNAKRQGLAAAANICGREVAYDRVPYLYSDQYDVGMEYRGYAPEWDEVVVRGDLERPEFHAFWLQRGRVAAAMNVNLWNDGDALQALVESGAPVDPRRLADPAVALEELAAQGAAA